MPKFNKKQQYITPSGRKFGKGVWYDDNGKLIRPGQGFYEKATKTVIQYNSDGTISRLSRQQWAKRKQADTEMRALQNDRRYAIPFIPEKKMTIHIDKNSPTARNRGAVISENLLDSIALNAKKAGLPFRDAIGMASQESTLGGGNRKVGQSLQPWLHTLNASPRRAEGDKISYQGVQSPSLLISNWKPYTENFFAPYAEYFYNSQLKFNPKGGDYYEGNFRGSLYRANRQAPENTSPLYQGYRSYKKNPTKYNGNDKDYPNKVRRAGDELVNHSPEIRNYMQQHNIHAYGGSLDNLRKWDELSLGEKSEIMRTALQRGITRLNEIRKAYNEYAEGGALPPSVGQYADEIYENSVEEPYGDPSPHYDNVDTALVQRLVPDARGHYDDIVKLPNHPSSPVRGTFNGNYFDLTDKGMEDPNYTLFGLIDNGDAGTVLRYNGDYVLPEITVTPEGNYYDDTYNDIRIKPKLHNFGGDMDNSPRKDSRYNHVTTIYQSFINQGVNPQVALELTNQKVAEKGWNGWVSGDNKRYNNVDSFTDHVVDHYNRLYPDSLKSNNFNQFFQGIEGGRTKYNPYPNTYKQHLLQTRPGVKKRINMYRRSKGQSPLTLLSLPNANVMPWEDASIFNQGFMGQMQEEPEGTIAAYGGHLFKGGGSIRDQRVSQAISYFINKGLTREQAAGLVGNFMRESQMNPSALNKYSGAYGLGQWLGARKTKLFKRYGKNPTFENQLDYVWDELNSSHKKGLKMLRQSKTVDDAARNVFGYYEFSAGPEAAVAAMNKSGMGTKWKNPDGTLALNSGINYAHAAYNRKPSKVIPGLNPGKPIKIGSGLNTTLPDYDFGNSDGLLTDLPLQSPASNSANTPDLSYVLAHNPTDYGTPTVYSIPERKQADTLLSDDYEPESNGTRLLGFMNALGILDSQSNSQPLASYTPQKQNNAPFIISAPQAGNTMLDASWFKEGGYLYNDGGYTDSDVNVSAARQMLHNDIMSNPKIRNDYKDYSEEEILSAMLADKNLTTSMVANPMYQKYLTDDDIKSLPEVTVTPSQKKDANGDYYNANTSYYNSAFHPEDAINFMNTATLGGLNNLSVTQWARRLYDAGEVAKGNMTLDDYANAWINGNNGIVTDNFAQEHPYLSTGINLATDIAAPFAGYKAYSRLTTPSTANKASQAFKSELDWSPESWFGTRINGKYDVEDVAALQSHVPEYLTIEQKAKADGTWLKMPDGSIWEGDPRSWVQLQSKEGQQLMQKPFYHGEKDRPLDLDGNNNTATDIGEGVLWTSSNKYLPHTYGNNHYVLSIPRNTEIVGVDAQGRNFNDLEDLGLGYKNTDDVTWNLLSDNNAVEIKNVVDVGHYPKWRAGKNGLPSDLPRETAKDYYERVFTGDDYVLGNYTPRKSLLGNNGNFDLTNFNIYKGVLPWGIPAVAWSKYKRNE